MAYNLESLITILKQILNPEHTRWILDQNKPQLESLLQKSCSLQQILEKSPALKMERLESRIRDAVYEAEDIIESHMVYQMTPHTDTGGTSFTLSTQVLEQVKQQLDAVMEQVVVLMRRKETEKAVKLMPTETTPAATVSSWSSSAPLMQTYPSENKSAVVGVDKDLMSLKDRLTGEGSKLEIVPIVGMGGIGKTTLAHNLYNDPVIISHFKVRGWATISQVYNMQKVVLDLLHGILGEKLDPYIGMSIDKLRDILYRSLYGRRYMIVLDDIWSTKFWDEIRRYFPDNNNGSRIMITSRETDIAKHAGSQSDQQHHVQLLSKSKSWNLLCRVVFGEEEHCPFFLAHVGKRIASECGGLPLAIAVVGGLLSKAPKSTDAWENIGKQVRGVVTESHDKRFFLDVLSLSYKHLPNHLRPCFLYMGAFPEDYEIKASRLVRMWVAEGFLKSTEVHKALEEEAEGYLNDLVQRNLIIVRDHKYNKKAKWFSVHDLLRDLCLRKADEEKFLHVNNEHEVVSPSSSDRRPRRVSVHKSSEMERVCASAETFSLARSFLGAGPLFRGILSPAFLMLRLLRVLDVIEMKFQKFPIEIFQLVNLRYLAIWCYSSLPSGISRLWYLQTLIANFGWGDLPCEIWEMPELRHLKLNEVIWVEDEYIKAYVQRMLQKISSVMLTPSLLRNGFFESMPNIKDLGICCDVVMSSTVDLSHLHKLEILRCQSSRRQMLPNLIFPSALQKLTLADCVIFPGFSETLCALPNLQVLNVKRCVFEGESRSNEWELEEGDAFDSLRLLRLERLDLVRWSAEWSNFPRLEHLLLVCCYKLEEIPMGIGDISTLILVELYECSRSAEASARAILEEQSELGNEDIKVEIN